MLKIFIKAFTVFLFIMAFSLQSGGQLIGDSNHTFYLYGKSNSAKIHTISEKEAKNFIYFKFNLSGESVIFYNKDNLKKTIKDLNANLIFSENGEDFNCEYYYSKQIKGGIILNGEKINLHVCYLGDQIVVGTPIVYGSF